MNNFRSSDYEPNLLNSPGVECKEAKPVSGGKSFAETIKDPTAKVEDMQKAADQSATDLALGRTKTLPLSAWNRPSCRFACS